MHPDGKESYLSSSSFFLSFFCRHGRVNTDPGESGVGNGGNEGEWGKEGEGEGESEPHRLSMTDTSATLSTSDR